MSPVDASPSSFCDGVMRSGRWLPGISSQFSGSGRYGSGAQQFATTQAANNLTRNLADASSNMYANAYGQERGLQDADVEYPVA